MKKISLLLIVFSISVIKMAQEQLSTSQQAIQQTVIEMFDALSNRDSISPKTYCTADIALYEYGQVWNIDTLILRAINKAIRLAAAKKTIEKLENNQTN